MSLQLETPVALVFFNRPDTFSRVFEKVRKVRPQKIFLIQDGPRENNSDDLEKINQCRKIAENIDWNCEVHKNYSEVNLGCGERPASGISWVFDNVDRAIILEDDCVPCDTFFRYCEEMLERYKDDQRISYISGLNHFEEWDCGEYSYFFAKTGAIWGWATWKRAWGKYDYYASVINDEYVKRILPLQISDKDTSVSRMNSWKIANQSIVTNEKLSYWDGQWGLVKYSQNQLVIVPKYNQISNIGIGESSSHAQSIKRNKFRKYKSFFFIPTKELEFPLTHQTVCMCDMEYDNLVYTSTRGNRVIYNAKKLVKKALGRA